MSGQSGRYNPNNPDVRRLDKYAPYIGRSLELRALAQELYDADKEVRLRRLTALKNDHPTYHTMVVNELHDIRGEIHMKTVKYSVDPAAVNTQSPDLRRRLESMALADTGIKIPWDEAPLAMIRKAMTKLVKEANARLAKSRKKWQVAVTYDMICSHVFEVDAKDAAAAIIKAEQAANDTDMSQYFSSGAVSEIVIVGRPTDVKFKNPSGQVGSKQPISNKNQRSRSCGGRPAYPAAAEVGD